MPNAPSLPTAALSLRLARLARRRAKIPPRILHFDDNLPRLVWQTLAMNFRPWSSFRTA